MADAPLPEWEMELLRKEVSREVRGMANQPEVVEVVATVLDLIRDIGDRYGALLVAVAAASCVPGKVLVDVDSGLAHPLRVAP